MSSSDTTRLGLAETHSIVAEAAADRVAGRPRHANPYSREFNYESWHAWDFGWTEFGWYLDNRGQHEATRWLEEQE